MSTHVRKLPLAFLSLAICTENEGGGGGGGGGGLRNECSDIRLCI